LEPTTKKKGKKRLETLSLSQKGVELYPRRKKEKPTRAWARGVQIEKLENTIKSGSKLCVTVVTKSAPQSAVNQKQEVSSEGKCRARKKNEGKKNQM